MEKILEATTNVCIHTHMSFYDCYYDFYYYCCVLIDQMSRQHDSVCLVGARAAHVLLQCASSLCACQAQFAISAFVPVFGDLD